MNRLGKRLKDIKSAGEKALSIFVTAGYPELDSTAKLVWNLAEAGADLVEIGIPFSDPIADGVTIQKSSQKALENGITLKRILHQVEEIRKGSELPVILMGYLNPVAKYGFQSFVKDAENAGVDGLILPDLIPEESFSYQEVVKTSKIGLNYLVSPNTPGDRLRTIDGLTRDFIYCVALTGVTGSREGLPPGIADYLSRVKGATTHPYLVGFGISNPQDARAIARHADGVIIGSAIIKLIAQSANERAMLKATSRFTSEIKKALKGA
jgi:tryptophan synthase alpha chain